MKKQKYTSWFESTFLESFRPFLWIVAVGFLLYGRSLFFQYTLLDDNVLILDNLFFLKNLGNITKTFTQEVFHVLHASAAYYRPILTLSFMLDAQFSAGNPFFYHVSNVAIHLIVSCLVYVFLQKLEYKKELAFIFAIIFTVHPVLTQAVSWIPGRNDSLLALFFLSSFIFLINYLKSSASKQILLHFLFFTLALFTKESTVFFPFIAFVYIGLFCRKKVELIHVVFLTGGWIIVGMMWFLLRSTALVNPVGYTVGGAIEIIIKHFPATFLFLGKVLFPFNLSVLPILSDSTFLYGIVALVFIILSVVFSKEKRFAPIAFGLFWFLLFLLPSYIRPSTTYVADFLEHRLYLPIIGLFILFLEIDWVKRFDKNNASHITFVAALFLFFASITLWHEGHYKNPLNFWQNAVVTSPSHPLSHKNLGAHYYLNGELEKAEKYFKNALALNPTETMIHNNLGLIYMDQKDYKRAEDEYKKELAINPLYDRAFFNYGVLYYLQEKYDKARDMWLKTLKINPDHTGALQNLAVYYNDRKDKAKANYYLNELKKRSVGK